MKKTFLLVVVGCLSFLLNLKATKAEIPSAPEGYAYVLFGDGRASNGGGKIGHENSGQYGFEIVGKKDYSWRIMYNNEGHPKNVGHRDGYAGLLILPLYTFGEFELDGGFGPYFSMNTVDRTGKNQRNEKGVGLVAALSLKYPISDSLLLLLQLNKTRVHSEFYTRQFSAGVGYNFSHKKGGLSSGEQEWDTGYKISLWTGPSNTTRSGGKGATGFMLEIQKPLSVRNLAVSASALSEGENCFSDRTGIVGQVWYVTTPNEIFTFGAGVGPYLAKEKNAGNRGLKGLALVTFRGTAEISKSLSVGAQFVRAVSFYNKDQDMFLAGIQKKF